MTDLLRKLEILDREAAESAEGAYLELVDQAARDEAAIDEVSAFETIERAGHSLAEFKAAIARKRERMKALTTYRGLDEAKQRRQQAVESLGTLEAEFRDRHAKFAQKKSQLEKEQLAAERDVDKCQDAADFLMSSAAPTPREASIGEEMKELGQQIRSYEIQLRGKPSAQLDSLRARRKVLEAEQARLDAEKLTKA